MCSGCRLAQAYKLRRAAQRELYSERERQRESARNSVRALLSAKHLLYPMARFARVLCATFAAARNLAPFSKSERQSEVHVMKLNCHRPDKLHLQGNFSISSKLS